VPELWQDGSSGEAVRGAVLVGEEQRQVHTVGAQFANQNLLNHFVKFTQMPSVIEKA
jgi:hypothetical protein